MPHRRWLLILFLGALALGATVAPSSGGLALSSDANVPLPGQPGCLVPGPGAEPDSPLIDAPLSRGCTRPLGVMPIAGSAAGAGAGSINGTVTEEGTGEPLSNVCVIVSNSIGFIVGHARTDALGAYHVAELPDGGYKVSFVDCGTSGFHRSELYDDAADFGSADLVVISGGGKVAGVDAALSPGGGAISGLVWRSGTAEAISGACVQIYDLKFVAIALAISDAGVYSVGGLPAGDYRVRVESCFEPQQIVMEWYENASGFVAADVVSVTGGETTQGINMSVTAGASLNGTVREEGSGLPLAGICVFAVSSDSELAGLALTDGDGDYSLAGLANEDHSVAFLDCQSPRYHLLEWYDDEASFSTAGPVSVGGPGSKTAGINARLSKGGSIGGRVTEAGTGSPVDACVSVFDADSGQGYVGFTDGDGEYEVGGLPPATYKVRFRDCATPAAHPWEWHLNEATYADADRVVVNSSRTSAINAVLARGAGISGTITEQGTGLPLWTVCVDVYDLDRNWVGFSYTNALGRYSVGLDLFSAHKLFFWDCSSGTHAPEWYQNEEYFDVANMVATAAAGSNHGSIDAALRTVDAGDADCDGSVTSIDAVVVLQADAGLLNSVFCFGAADVNENGDLNALDAVLILQFVAGLIPTLPI